MSNINYYSESQSHCQEKQSVGHGPSVNNWSSRLEGLAQTLPLIKHSPQERSKFYASYLEMCQEAARVVLCKMSWHGDLFHDSQDVASECVKNLIQQEEKGNGAFSQDSRTPDQFRGYLSRTIYRSCKQRALDLLGKVARQSRVKQRVEIEAGDRLRQLHREFASQPWRRLALKDALEALRKAHRRQLPKGITPLHCVLDDAMGEALLEGKVPLRTLQRYKQQARETIAKHMGIDLSTRQRQLKWESWKYHCRVDVPADQVAARSV